MINNDCRALWVGLLDMREIARIVARIDLLNAHVTTIGALYNKGFYLLTYLLVDCYVGR